MQELSLKPLAPNTIIAAGAINMDARMLLIVVVTSIKPCVCVHVYVFACRPMLIIVST